MRITWPVELVTETIWGLTAVAVVGRFEFVDPGGVMAVTSSPRVTLPRCLVAAVNRDELTVNGTDEPFPAVVTADGIIANVLPWPALRTIRSSNNSGVGHRRCSARGNPFEVFIRPSLA